MNNKKNKIMVKAGLLGALLLAAGTVQGVPELISFSSGAPVVAADFNTNFTRLRDAIETLEGQVSSLEGQVASLEGELDEAGDGAGHVILPDGGTTPLLSKVLQGTKGATTTTTLPHGIPGNVSSERRIIGCQVVSNYDAGRQTISLNLSAGASTAAWCDIDDTDIQIQWVTETAIPNGGSFHVTIDYIEVPLD